MDKVLEFAKKQRVMAIATSTGNDQWIANVYIGTDDNFNIYFVSPLESKHSKMIIENPNVVFSLVWFDKTNHKNRKAVQGKGTCRLAEDNEITTGVKLHNENFPVYKELITTDWVNSNEGSRVWILKPTYIKYWDDELYGDKSTEEFNL